MEPPSHQPPAAAGEGGVQQRRSERSQTQAAHVWVKLQSPFSLILSFLSPFAVGVQGRAERLPQTGPASSDTSPSLARFPQGRSCGCRRGQIGGGRTGEGEGEKMNSCKPITADSAVLSNAARQSNSAWCLSSFSRLVPAWDSGKGLSDCPLCLTSQRGPSQPQFPKERDLGWRCLFSSEKTGAECSGSSFITLSCPSSANNPSGV